MNLKKLVVVFLLICSLIVAGCVTDEEPDVTEDVPEDNVSDDMPDDDQPEMPDMDNETVEEDSGSAGEVNGTPAEEGTENEEDDGVTVVESTGPRTYTVTLKNFLAQPGSLTINEGDSVFWINMNQPTRTFTLISEEDLWEDKPLTYRSSFTYTFDETGNYSYYVLGFEERMKGTITVK